MPEHFRCQRFYKTLDKVEFSQTFYTLTNRSFNLCISRTGMGSLACQQIFLLHTLPMLSMQPLQMQPPPEGQRLWICSPTFGKVYLKIDRRLKYISKSYH